MEEDKGTVCVTGATGYVASWLIMRLLQHGYSVRATVRSDPANCKKDISYLTNLPEASKKLQFFHADLNKPDSFNTAIGGCIGVFHLAHPMDVDGKESEEAVTKRAVEGTLGILRACLNSKRSVKRVLYISSAATILYNNKGLSVADESTWSDLDICRSSKLVNPSYLLSKTITERIALEFAAKNGLDLITLVLPLVVGSFICPTTPSSVSLALAMILGEEDHYEYLMHSYMVHIDDVASAQIFLLEYPNAQGRYICSSAEMTMHQMYEFLLARYPEFQLPNMEE
nr:protein bri1-5 enhanced 1 [Quercus suber]POF05780.1 protein bri1-5 enhanced 1 [Quercus suber]